MSRGSSFVEESELREGFEWDMCPRVGREIRWPLLRRRLRDIAMVGREFMAMCYSSIVPRPTAHGQSCSAIHARKSRVLCNATCI